MKGHILFVACFVSCLQHFGYMFAAKQATWAQNIYFYFVMWGILSGRHDSAGVGSYVFDSEI